MVSKRKAASNRRMAQVREPLHDRAAGQCERCGVAAGGRADAHHRQRRTVGGDGLSNLGFLCGGCHRQVHAEPENAREQGWIISSYDDRHAALVPVRFWGSWVLIDDDGSITAAPEMR